MLNLEEEKALEGGRLKADEEIHWKSDLKTGIGCALGLRRGASLADFIDSSLR